MNCNVEYEEGRKFCKYCGEPLVPKIEPISTQKKVRTMEEGKSDGRLICPDCKMVYEFGSSCIQCGVILVPNLSPGVTEETKSNHQETAEERGALQAQPPQGQQIKKLLQQLICPDCQIIYERGNSCIKCGSALVLQAPSQTKEDLKEVRELDPKEKSIPPQIIQEPLIEGPKKKFLCPTCKIIYEREGTCIRCGLTLVTQHPSQEEEKSKLPELPKVEAERSFLPRPRENGSESGEQAKAEEVEVPPGPEPIMKKETPQLEPLERQRPSRLTDDLEKRLSLSKKTKIDYRRLSLEIGSLMIMAVAGGYIFWSVFSHMNKETAAKTFSSKEIPSSVLLAPSKAPNAVASVSIPQKNLPQPPESSSSDRTFSETRELEKIKGLLENIRQANLKKNIDLFLSCYSTDFKDRESKKKSTLENWKKFDYLDLSYDLRNPSISGDIAKVRVEWLIKIFATTGGKPQENKTILDVLLKKEEGEWKIKEVKLTS